MNNTATPLKTPDRILNSALTLMLKEGYHGVSVDSIIARSGVSKGTFFYHFKSKDALAERLLTRFFQQQGKMLRTLMVNIEAKYTTPEDQLLHFLETFPTAYQKNNDPNGCLMAAFSYQLIAESDTLRAICHEAIQGWASFFTPYLTRALPPSTTEKEANELAAMFFCLLEGALIIERIEQSPELDTQFRHFSRYLRLLIQTES